MVKKSSRAYCAANAAYKFEQFNQRFGSMALWILILVGRDLITYPIRVVSFGVLAAVGLA